MRCELIKGSICPPSDSRPIPRLGSKPPILDPVHLLVHQDLVGALTVKMPCGTLWIQWQWTL